VTKPTCSVVVPVYNGADTLEPLVQRLADVLPNVTEAFEVILVNDGSPDNSWDVIERLADQNSWVVGIRLMRNFGQHNATLCGIRQARYELIVTMDDDLQNPPEEIESLLVQLAKGYDVVYGVPQREQHGLWRDLASQATKIMLRGAMGVGIARNVSAFRAFRTHVRNGFAQYAGPFVSVDVLLTWGASRYSSVQVRQEPRTLGASNYTFRKLVAHALNMITGFSTLPLRIASLLGFSFTFFGAGVLVYVVGRYLIEGTSVAGFPFLASVIAIFSGVQLLTLGVMGEYMARMYSRMLEKPPYVVRDVKETDSQRMVG